MALVTTTPEEVVLNFGISAVPPTPEREVVVDINNRVILSFTSAKRLALTLGSIISRSGRAARRHPSGHAGACARPRGCAMTLAGSGRRAPRRGQP